MDLRCGKKKSSRQDYNESAAVEDMCWLNYSIPFAIWQVLFRRRRDGRARPTIRCWA
jgi:hypothetical protein